MRKKGTIGTPEEEWGKSRGRWLLTFNDLMTLLLTFFVLLFTMSSLDFRRLKLLQGSLKGALGVLKEGKRVEVEIIEPVILSEEMVEKVLTEIQDSIRSSGFEPDVVVTQTEKEAVITLADTILFESGIADINPGALPLLDKICSLLSKISLPIRIEGHTDNLPIHTERFPSNWELSIARAVNVVKYFIKVGKISPRRLSAVGYGDSKPIFPNDTPEHRARNRRVEIVLVMEDKR
jgi:chemotaxis protein MotB